MFETRTMRQLIRFFALTVLSFALMYPSVLSADEGFERWWKRIPGQPVRLNFESTSELHHHCPEFVGPLAERGVRGGFTQDCEARLDEQFFNEIPPLMPFTAKDNRITWRYVFDQPEVKRWRVRDALSNPECLSASDDMASDGLADRCHVDALVDYAVLKYQCAGDYYGTRGRIDEGIELPWYYVFPLERLFNNESYWRKRWGIENGYFRYAWITAKCAGLPDGVLASLGVFENTMDFGGEPAQGEEDWWWAEQGFEAFQLMGVAERLFANLSRTKYGEETDTLSIWQRVEPVMAELVQIKHQSTFSNPAEFKPARLKHFVAAQTWMKKRRTAVNEVWLLEQVGEFSDQELAQASEEATAMMYKQGVGTTWN